MRELRANTEVIVTVGPFVDVGDGFTPQTDITLGGDEAELIKHGSTSVVDISGATWAAVTSCRGAYSLTLTTSHTDTPGNLRVVVQDDSDCLPVTQDFVVLTEHAWDLKYADEGTGGGIKQTKLWYGTFSAADSTTITMANDTAANAIYAGARVMIALESGTNCTGRNYFGTVGASRVITVDPPFSADSGDTPSGTIVGAVYAAPKSPTSSVPTVNAASVLTILGALADAAATGAVTSSDTVMAYVKQIVTNTLNPAGFKKNEAVEDLSWPMLDGNGDVVSGETVSMTIQKDGGTPAAVTGTIDEIGSTGHYQITTSPALTATEMNANHVYLVATSTNAKPTIMQFYPETTA